MKKPFSAEDWVMIILAATIPISVLIIPLNRLLGGAALSDNASSVINSLVTAIGVGLIGLLQRKIGQPNDDTKP